MKYLQNTATWLIALFLIVFSGCNQKPAGEHTFAIGDQDIPVRRKAVCDQSRGDPLHPYSGRILGAPNPTLQSARHEYDLHLCILEHP